MRKIEKGERGSKESKKVNVRNRKKKVEVEKKCPRCKELDKCIPLK